MTISFNAKARAPIVASTALLVLLLSTITLPAQNSQSNVKPVIIRPEAQRSNSFEVSIDSSQTKDADLKVPQSAPKLTRILFIFDASQSMLARWQSDQKINIAKRLLTSIVDSLSQVKNLQMGLRVFGHQHKYPPPDCNDTRLEVAFDTSKGSDIIQKINKLEALGTTPIALTLQACEQDFPDNKARNIVILVTDGIEECQGDPCLVSLALQKKGAIVRPFVIGMGVDPALLKKTYDCVGVYYDAKDEKMFKSILELVISQALNKTTTQINLLDEAGNPTETNVPMTLYEKKQGDIKYNFVHTMNGYGVPDTLFIDPLFRYKLQVHTIPPVVKDSIRLTPGKHNIIPIKTPQGFLHLAFSENSDYKELTALVKKAGSSDILHVQKFNSKEKYLCGTYDLEVLCLPRLTIPNVNVRQSHTTTITIPQPGFATFSSNGQGYGSVFLEEGKELVWVCNLNTNTTNETLVLQPGNYKAIFRTKTARLSIYTITQSFKVQGGKSIQVSLY